MPDVTPLSSLAPNVAIVAIFIWYLGKRDKAVSQTLQQQGEIVRQALSDFSKHLLKLAHAIDALERRLESVEEKRMKK